MKVSSPPRHSLRTLSSSGSPPPGDLLRGPKADLLSFYFLVFVLSLPPLPSHTLSPLSLFSPHCLVDICVLMCTSLSPSSSITTCTDSSSYLTFSVFLLTPCVSRMFPFWIGFLLISVSVHVVRCILQSHLWPPATLMGRIGFVAKVPKSGNRHLGSDRLLRLCSRPPPHAQDTSITKHGSNSYNGAA